MKVVTRIQCESTTRCLAPTRGNPVREFGSRPTEYYVLSPESRETAEEKDLSPYSCVSHDSRLNYFLRYYFE